MDPVRGIGSGRVISFGGMRRPSTDTGAADTGAAADTSSRADASARANTSARADPGASANASARANTSSRADASARANTSEHGHGCQSDAGQVGQDALAAQVLGHCGL